MGGPSQSSRRSGASSSKPQNPCIHARRPAPVRRARGERTRKQQRLMMCRPLAQPGCWVAAAAEQGRTSSSFSHLLCHPHCGEQRVYLLTARCRQGARAACPEQMCPDASFKISRASLRRTRLVALAAVSLSLSECHLDWRRQLDRTCRVATSDLLVTLCNICRVRFGARMRVVGVLSGDCCRPLLSANITLHCMRKETVSFYRQEKERHQPENNVLPHGGNSTWSDI